MTDERAPDGGGSLLRHFLEIAVGLAKAAAGQGSSVPQPVLDHTAPEVGDARILFEDWSGYTEIPNLEITRPTTPQDVATACSKAAEKGYRVRALGHSHNWSPLIAPMLVPPGVKPPQEKILLIDTRALTMASHEFDNGQLRATFGTGTTLEAVTAYLAGITTGSPNGYAFANMPTPGGLTLGGVLAVGGHGTSVPFAGATEPDLMGCLSNLIVGFTAVVSDPASPDTYTLKSFSRSDPDASAFLVHLGRSFITDVTLTAIPNFNLQLTNVFAPMASLMADPATSPTGPTFDGLLTDHGRIELIWFPGEQSPLGWVQCATRYDETPPVPGGRTTTTPYNFGWMNGISQIESDALRALLTTVPSMTPLIMAAEQADAQVNMASTILNGAARDIQMYLTDDTLRMTAFGYVLQVERSQVQQAMHEFYEKVHSLITSHAGKSEHPVNGAVEIRCTTVDRQTDLGVTGAKPPAIAATHAVNDAVDTVLWVDVLTFPGTPSSPEFFVQLETWIKTTWGKRFGGQLRPEWSKGWGYTTAGPWTDQEMVSTWLPSVYDSATDGLGFTWAKDVLARYDASNIFTNSFLDMLFA